MAGTRTILSHTFLLGLVALSSGCVIHERGGDAAREEGYREGYYTYRMIPITLHYTANVRVLGLPQ